MSMAYDLPGKYRLYSGRRYLGSSTSFAVRHCFGFNVGMGLRCRLVLYLPEALKPVLNRAAAFVGAFLVQALESLCKDWA